MAARESLEEKLAALRALKGSVLTDEQKAYVRKRIGDRSNLVAAAAAGLAGEAGMREAANDLVAAFERFVALPAKDDRLCRAKLAAIKALEQLEHQHADVFHKAARHVQLEPVWGGSEDTAAELRANALVALARVEGTFALPTFVDALTDPARDVRSAAAVALGAVGSEAAALVLRLKTRIGDADPDVLSECLGGLLAIDPTSYLPFVAEFLRPADESACESAALALGRSRLAEALDPLVECLDRTVFPEMRRHLLLAIAILRRPNAVDYLVSQLETRPEADALEILTALCIYRDDPKMHERVANAVEGRKSRRLTAGFEQEFGAGD